MMCGGGGMGRYMVGAVLFLALGGFILWRRQTWVAKVRGQIAAAQRWPEANARVDATGTEPDTSVLGTLLSLVGGGNFRYPSMTIAYRFEVDGQIYQGNRLAFGKLDAHPRQARETLARYPKGGVIRIRYNPQDPRDNVVEPRELLNAKADWVIGPMVMGLGVIFMILGLTKGN